MYPNSPARSGYAAAAVRTERGSEYAVFAQVTSRLKAVDETDRSAFPRLAKAVADNQLLWGTLAEDLMGDGNRLPVDAAGEADLARRIRPPPQPGGARRPRLGRRPHRHQHRDHEGPARQRGGGGMTGLVLKLGPHERIMINGVVMENGDRRARLNVLTPEANVLRLRDAIHPDEANTPVRRVCYIAQLVLAGEADPEEASRQLAARHRAALPGVPGRRQPRRISPPPPRRCMPSGASTRRCGRCAASCRARRGCSACARHPDGSARWAFSRPFPLAGIAGWRFLERTQAAQQAAFDKSPEIARDIAYFAEKIGGDHHAPPTWLADRRLLKVALGAFGMESEIDKKAFIRKVLEEGIDRPEGAGEPADRQVALRSSPRPSASGRPAAREHRATSGSREDHRGLQDPRLRGRGGRRRQQHAPGDELPPRDGRALAAGRGGRELVRASSARSRCARCSRRPSACRAQFGQIDIDRQREIDARQDERAVRRRQPHGVPGSGGGRED